MTIIENNTLVSSVEKKFFVSYVCTYVLVLVLITPKSLPALILRVLASFVNSKLSINLLLSVKTRTAVPPRWQQQGRLPHGNKVSSVDAHI